jgi:hypothetical protein
MIAPNTRIAVMLQGEGFVNSPTARFNMVGAPTSCLLLPAQKGLGNSQGPFVSVVSNEDI